MLLLKDKRSKVETVLIVAQATGTLAAMRSIVQAVRSNLDDNLIVRLKSRATGWLLSCAYHLPPVKPEAEWKMM